MTSEIPSKVLESNKKRREEMLKRGELVINEQFSDATCEDLYFSLLELSKNKNIEDIKIYIHSSGGDVYALFPLLNLIDSMMGKTNVHTIIIGKAFSAGVMLALGGHKGFRSAHKDSSLLIHEVATDGGQYSKNTQFQIDADNMNKINGRLSEIIREKTKISAKALEKYMSSNVDIFISAKEAKDMGIIDHIIG